MSAVLPVRRPDVLVHRLGDELLAHRPGSPDVHALAGPAATLWEHCDGRTTVAAAAAALGLDEAAVLDALAGLAALDLVDAPAGVDRRRFLGGALAGTAFITTLALPSAAMAGSDGTSAGNGGGAGTTPVVVTPTQRPSSFGPGLVKRTVPAGATGLVLTLRGGDGVPGSGTAGGRGSVVTVTIPGPLAGPLTFEASVGGLPGGAAGTDTLPGGAGPGGAGSTLRLGTDGPTFTAGGGGGGGAPGAGGATLSPGGDGTSTERGVSGGPGPFGGFGGARGTDPVDGASSTTGAGAGGGGGGGLVPGGGGLSGLLGAATGAGGGGGGSAGSSSAPLTFTAPVAGEALVTTGGTPGGPLLTVSYSGTSDLTS